ncbi:recombination associated protein RdgC [Roseateles sp. YR242]|uniref:recombination-associated protein RdgC n=1 Tax=Roseateles sp. YR242 TaxID=1855305 RepID=UPI0008B46436|nr:recombination-associated protein RdgC [Roseateles sp. YR242]SEL13051.1 recombination associated protein RdgC [Roseateles sp. YR242]
MFKQLILYRIGADWSPNADLFQDSLERDCFAPCGATQALSAGWVSPRGEEGGALLEQIDGHWLLSLRLEKRILPGAVVREVAEERAEQYYDETGRKPGKKQLADIKEQVVLDLLPQAFTTKSHLRVWISPALRLVMVEAGSISKADELISLLIKADPSLNLHLLQSAESPAACMGAWLMDGVPPEHFVIDRDCELKAADEMKSVVKYGRHNLDRDDVKAHLMAGKMPTRLAMTFKERISFTLTDTLQIKGIKFLDVVFDGRDKPAKDEAFDVDMALATGELSQLIPALIDALGGELDFAGQSQKVAAEDAPKSAPNPSPSLDEILKLARVRGYLTRAILMTAFQMGESRASTVLHNLMEVEVISLPDESFRFHLLERESP